MSDISDSEYSATDVAAGGTGREREQELAELLSSLDQDAFIPAAAIDVVAEIVTFLHSQLPETAQPETES